MPLALQPLEAGDADLLLAIARDPSLAAEFELIQSRVGAEAMLGDPFASPSVRWAARVNGEPVAFCFAFVLPSWQGDWAMVRLGVRGDHRRRGIGSSLLTEASAALSREAPGCGELCLSAWLPSPSATAFARHHRFEPVRTFWLMEHPPVDPPPPEWPAGVTVRSFDASARALEDWNEAYNASFAKHYHGVRSTPASARAHAEQPGFLPDGLLLAYRDGRCVGFCKNELHPGRGEVGTLGVVPAARGAGIGRALLRWGVAWLRRAGAERLTLVVDGQNENALSLYRQERFEVVRTRQIWSRRPS
jgi:mycothiol synthase